MKTEVFEDSIAYISQNHSKNLLFESPHESINKLKNSSPGDDHIFCCRFT